MTSPAWYRDGDEWTWVQCEPTRHCPACADQGKDENTGHPLYVLRNPDWPVALLCRGCGYQEAVEVGGEG